MNKAEAEKIFRAHIMPSVVHSMESDGVIDRPARREAWHNFTDSLCKDGEITQRQYDTWSNPSWLEYLSPYVIMKEAGMPARGTL